MNPSPLKVLAFDNELLMLYALERAFKGRSFDIKTVATPEQALLEIESCPFELFLLELDLQDNNCLELLKTIDERCPYIPIIFMVASVMSSSELGDVIRAIRKHGAWHLLEKPFSLDKMLGFVSAIFQDHDAEIFRMNSLTHNYEQEHRDQFRRSHVLPIHFSYFSIVDGFSMRIPAKGILTDISEYGSGVLAHVPMQADQVICFDGDFPKQNGIVAWSSMIEAETCRFGVQFC